MTKAKVKPEQVPQKSSAPSDAQVVADMQRFFHSHGYYRVEDVHRILGDPSGGVTASASSSLVFGKTHK